MLVYFVQVGDDHQNLLTTEATGLSEDRLDHMQRLTERKSALPAEVDNYSEVETVLKIIK